MISQMKIMKQKKQLENINKKAEKQELEELKQQITPKWFDNPFINKIKYKYNIFKKYINLKLNIFWNKHKLKVGKVFSVAIWSLFILAVLHLFGIVAFNYITYLECIALFFIINEIAYFIDGWKNERKINKTI